MNELEAYKRFCKIINSLNPYSIKLGLERVEQFCKKLGNPQDSFRSILVGGTNGKGSVCQFLTDCFVKSGYTCGTYTSPHLILSNERFKINGKPVDFLTLLEYAEFIDRINFESLTYFEFLTVLAFLLFKDFGVDIAILEVGMGGEFDATNVVNPLLSIITSISLDHEEHLGKTIEEIALTKSKIIRDVAIIAANPDTVINTIKKNVNAELYFVDDVYLKVGNFNTFNSVNPNNLATALLAIDVLNNKFGFHLKLDGLKSSFWPGRFQVMRYNGKTIIIDGAHNKAGVENLLNLIKDRFGEQKNALLIFSSLTTKKWRDYLPEFAQNFDTVWLVRVENRLSENPFEIEYYLIHNSFKGKVDIFENTNDCLINALESDFDFIVITGSLYLVGEVLGCGLYE